MLLDELTGMLTYEGHDEPQRAGGPNPKEVDQPLTTPRGSWTENGKFFRAAKDFASGLREKPDLGVVVQVTHVADQSSVPVQEHRRLSFSFTDHRGSFKQL